MFIFQFSRFILFSQTFKLVYKLIYWVDIKTLYLFLLSEYVKEMHLMISRKAKHSSLPTIFFLLVHGEILQHKGR